MEGGREAGWVLPQGDSKRKEEEEETENWCKRKDNVAVGYRTDAATHTDGQV